MLLAMAGFPHAHPFATVACARPGLRTGTPGPLPIHPVEKRTARRTIRLPEGRGEAFLQRQRQPRPLQRSRPAGPTLSVVTAGLAAGATSTFQFYQNQLEGLFALILWQVGNGGGVGGVACLNFRVQSFRQGK